MTTYEVQMIEVKDQIDDQVMDQNYSKLNKVLIIIYEVTKKIGKSKREI